VTALVLLAGSALVVGSIYPAFVQSVQVRPTELVRESPYIQRNIEATRSAYGLDDVQVTDYVTSADLTAQTLAQIIFEEEKKSPRIGADVLRKIIQVGLPAE